MAAMKKGGLGRGIDTIFSDNEKKNEEATGATTVRIALVEPKVGQPRKNFDAEELQNLALSIAQYGIIQPITVRKVGDMYRIIAGERRWRAARMAGLSEIPVVIMDADEQKSAEMALVENIQRQNLNPIEEAEAIEALMDEFGLTQDEASKRIGRSRSSVANLLRLLDLPDSVREYVSSGALSAGHAKAILALENKDRTEEAAKTVIAAEMSVRDTEKLIRKMNAERANVDKPAPAEGINYTRELERKVEKALGRRVKIKENGKLSSISIGYTDYEDLEKVLLALCGKDFVDSI